MGNKDKVFGFLALIVVAVLVLVFVVSYMNRETKSKTASVIASVEKAEIVKEIVVKMPFRCDDNPHISLSDKSNTRLSFTCKENGLLKTAIISQIYGKPLVYKTIIWEDDS